MCANASGFTDKGGDWTPATALLPQLGNPTLPREYIIFVVTGGTGRTGATPTIHRVGIEARPVATPGSTTGGAPLLLQLLLDAAHGAPHIDFYVQRAPRIGPRYPMNCCTSSTASAWLRAQVRWKARWRRRRRDVAADGRLARTDTSSPTTALTLVRSLMDAEGVSDPEPPPPNVPLVDAGELDRPVPCTSAGSSVDDVVERPFGELDANPRPL